MHVENLQLFQNPGILVPWVLFNLKIMNEQNSRFLEKFKNSNTTVAGFLKSFQISTEHNPKNII